jgi:hypothetical protein
MGPAEQRDLALARAREAKMAAASLRSAIRAAGRRGGAERAARAALEADAPMPFYRLVRSVPRIGEQRANQLLATARINPEARVDAARIDRRRREVLAGELLRYANRAGR